MKSQGESKGTHCGKGPKDSLSKPQDVRKVPVEDIKRLIHELDVHQMNSICRTTSSGEPS